MKRAKYSRWDGTQKWLDLDGDELAERLFDELSHYMNWSLSAQEAMEWLMRQGVKLPDMNMRVMGTDELLQQLRQQRQQSFQQYNFNHALDDIRDKLERLVEREVATARSELGSVHPEFQRREEFLRGLPVKPGEAIDKLGEYNAEPGFLDAEAQAIYDELAGQQQTVKELEQFMLRYGRQFQGPESLDFEEAAEVMEQFKRMASLAEALRTGRFDEINIEDFKAHLGDEAAQSILILAHFAEQLEDSGYIQKTEDGVRLTPRGFRKIGQNALNEIFRDLKKDHLGLHDTNARGASRNNPEETAPYEFGRPFNVHIVRTVKNALGRGAMQGGRLQLEAQDFEVHEEEHDTQSTTVLMLDMSWSMSRDGRFPAAKRVALALDHLIRTSYPRDNYYTVGFSTRARELSAQELTEATWDPSDPFTNIQEGLWLSRQVFRRHRATNRQVIVITDGQPTATHINGYTNAQWPGFMGSIPPDIYRETLREVDNCTREKVTINVFMLDDNPVLTKFVEEMVRVNRGRAFYSLPHNLGRYLLVDYISRRRKQVA